LLGWGGAPAPKRVPQARLGSGRVAQARLGWGRVVQARPGWARLVWVRIWREERSLLPKAKGSAQCIQICIHYGLLGWGGAPAPEGLPGSSRLGQGRPGSSRLWPARPGSARLGWARVWSGARSLLPRLEGNRGAQCVQICIHSVLLGRGGPGAPKWVAQAHLGSGKVVQARPGSASSTTATAARQSRGHSEEQLSTVDGTPGQLRRGSALVQERSEHLRTAPGS